MHSLYFNEQFHNMRLTNKKTLHPHGTWNVRLNELLRSYSFIYNNPYKLSIQSLIK